MMPMFTRHHEAPQSPSSGFFYRRKRQHLSALCLDAPLEAIAGQSGDIRYRRAVRWLDALPLTRFTADGAIQARILASLISSRGYRVALLDDADDERGEGGGRYACFDMPPALTNLAHWRVVEYLPHWPHGQSPPRRRFRRPSMRRNDCREDCARASF